MQISLNSDLERFVEEKVSEGDYGNATEVVHDALTWFRDQSALNPADIAELRELIDAGIDELDRGEGEDWDPEEIKAEGRKLLARRRE